MLYPLSYGRSPLCSSADALLCNENLLYPRTCKVTNHQYTTMIGGIVKGV